MACAFSGGLSTSLGDMDRYFNFEDASVRPETVSQNIAYSEELPGHDIDSPTASSALGQRNQELQGSAPPARPLVSSEALPDCLGVTAIYHSKKYRRIQPSVTARTDSIHAMTSVATLSNRSRSNLYLGQDCFSLAPATPKPRARMTEKQKYDSREVRRVGSCLRCRRKKLKCCGSIPCDGCLKAASMGFDFACNVRATFVELNIFANFCDYPIFPWDKQGHWKADSRNDTVLVRNAHGHEQISTIGILPFLNRNDEWPILTIEVLSVCCATLETLLFLPTSEAHYADEIRRLVEISSLAVCREFDEILKSRSGKQTPSHAGFLTDLALAHHLVSKFSWLQNQQVKEKFDFMRRALMSIICLITNRKDEGQSRLISLLRDEENPRLVSSLTRNYKSYVSAENVDFITAITKARSTFSMLVNRGANGSDPCLCSMEHRYTGHLVAFYYAIDAETAELFGVSGNDFFKYMRDAFIGPNIVRTAKRGTGILTFSTSLCPMSLVQGSSSLSIKGSSDYGYSVIAARFFMLLCKREGRSLVDWLYRGSRDHCRRLAFLCLHTIALELVSQFEVETRTDSANTFRMSPFSEEIIIIWDKVIEWERRNLHRFDTIVHALALCIEDMFQAVSCHHDPTNVLRADFALGLQEDNSIWQVTWQGLVHGAKEWAFIRRQPGFIHLHNPTPTCGLRKHCSLCYSRDGNTPGNIDDE